jgi:general L-amino acid transport system permease protein
MRGVPRQSQEVGVGRLQAGGHRTRGMLSQALILLILASTIWFLGSNTVQNLQSRGITTGFEFLSRVTSLPIPNSLLSYTAGVSTYARAIVIGLANTLFVSFIVIALSTVAGTLIGIARMSPNWLLSRSCGAYIEAVRNIPVLLQLVFWYQLMLQLPGPRRALNPFEGIFVSSRGIRFPVLEPDPAHTWVLIAFFLGLLVTGGIGLVHHRQRERTGSSRQTWPFGIALVVIWPMLVWIASGAAFKIEWPAMAGFDFRGGGSLTPELSALTIGLTIYASAFVAEIVRAGILSVPRGQWEAAASLGLGKFNTLRKVVMPQALRIIVPPMTGEYLGIIKNSSLAVAIGYPDLVAIITTMISDTGQAVEGVAIIMFAFLTISLSVSALMNWYNARVALVSR